MSLRKKLIKLAYENKDLRPDLLPLLKEAAAVDPEFEKVIEGALEYLHRTRFDKVEKQRTSRDSGGFKGELLGVRKGVPVQVKLWAFSFRGQRVKLVYSYLKGVPGGLSILGGSGTSDQMYVPNDAVELSLFQPLLGVSLPHFQSSSSNFPKTLLPGVFRPFEVMDLYLVLTIPGVNPPTPK
jgi:hypothetical protein